MRLLVISPDYASHLLPLATLATAWRDAGDEVLVATGPATDSIVAGFGFRRVDLRLGRGSNPGVIRAEAQVRGEDDALRGFFDATRRGLVATLTYQANARRTDLLWEPVATGQRVLDVVAATEPDHVIVDHLAFSARLALAAGGVQYADVVLGHPSALPVAGEVYGSPPAWPASMTPSPSQQEELDALCRSVADDFTAEWNAASRALDPTVVPVTDAFALTGDLLLLNYPQALHDPARTALLPAHAFLGSAVRDESSPDDVAAWITGQGARPIVYVSFGSFLSARADALAKVVAGLRSLDVSVALATGSADPGVLGDIPPHWLVREHLPQVAIIAHAAVVVSHGGNNSITEALTFGVPQLVMPFSTEQPQGAAAVEDARVGLVLDPGSAGPGDVAAAVGELLSGAQRTRAAALGVALRAHPGREIARAAMLSP